MLSLKTRVCGKWIAVAVVLVFLSPSAGNAQPKGPPPGAKEAREHRKEAREHRKEAREQRKEAREEAREDIKDKREELREERKEAREARRRGASPEEMRERAREVVDARKDLRAARMKARDVAKRQLKVRLAKARNKVDRVALTAELRRHARIVARLARAREVAENADDKTAVERIDSLMAKENARHERWMNNHTPAK